jgi:hypothetical protein
MVTKVSPEASPSSEEILYPAGGFPLSTLLAVQLVTVNRGTQTLRCATTVRQTMFRNKISN